MYGGVRLERHAVLLGVSLGLRSLYAVGELSQVASEAHFFPGREYDILMTQDSSQPRVFSFAMTYVRALDPETKDTGGSVVYYECGLGMCLTNRSMVKSRQDLVGEQTSMGGRIVCIKFTEFFRDPQS